MVPLKGYPGVTMRRLNVAGQKTGGTTYIELDDVAVPVGNLIGREGDGMRIIMTNFNHERLTIAVGVTRQARVALASAFQYCLKREAFGKTLMDQPVVRHRLAKAGAELETMHAWVEQILYQLCHMSKEEGDLKLGGVTALAKAKSAMVLNECAQCAVLLFGGNGFTASGQGELVEGELYCFPLSRISLTRQPSTVTSLGHGFPEDRRTCCWIWQCVSWSRCIRRKRRHWVDRRFNQLTCVDILVQHKMRMMDKCWPRVSCSLIKSSPRDEFITTTPSHTIHDQHPQHKHSTISMQHSHVSSHRKQQHMAAMLVLSVCLRYPSQSAN